MAKVKAVFPISVGIEPNKLAHPGEEVLIEKAEAEKIIAAHGGEIVGSKAKAKPAAPNQQAIDAAKAEVKAASDALDAAIRASEAEGAGDAELEAIASAQSALDDAEAKLKALEA